MWLTGHPDGPPLAPGFAVVPALEATAAELRRLSAVVGTEVVVDVAELLTGRAALMGLTRRGRTSANGSCRLLPAADGWVAVNLARPSDVEAVPALVEGTFDGDPWETLTRALSGMSATSLVERATLLGLPLSVLPDEPARERGAGCAPRSRAGSKEGEGAGSTSAGQMLVVDLSSMWAGPVCAWLLGRVGMRVVKVESTTRPDGGRRGHPGFFGWLHGGHESVALDLTTATGRDQLAQLVARADIVVEASRPRALAQLGIDADAVVAARPGRTWVSITGHGRHGDDARRVAFGDDAAVAAGLVAWDDAGDPVFCADAIADPITGLQAAVGALTSVARGGGHLVDVAMVDAVAATLATPAATGIDPATPVARPRPPRTTGQPPARDLGADTDAVLAELGIPTPC
jgi:crotonobetainyl-CoA:carnitine CoA-transferase CaiB-like acyl-CoA transferase